MHTLVVECVYVNMYPSYRLYDNVVGTEREGGREEERGRERERERQRQRERERGWGEG